MDFIIHFIGIDDGDFEAVVFPLLLLCKKHDMRSSIENIHTQVVWNTGGKDFTIIDAHQASDEFYSELEGLLGRLLLHDRFGIQVVKERTMGFGEDAPRWSHENGTFVDNRPWEKW